jgi:hypothetical protein
MMRVTGVVMCVAAFLAGCGQGVIGRPMQAAGAEFRLLALTSLEPDAAGEGLLLRAYVQPEENFAAEWFRFELYEYVPLDANPRGKRIVFWPQVEPGPAGIANRYWRPHLEAYEIILPVESRLEGDKTYLVEVTALGDDGTRRSDTTKLKLKTLTSNPQ